METVNVEVWVMVDENGEYTVNVDPSELEPEPGVATRLVKVAVKVPVPKPVELVATIGAEPDAAELKVA